MIMNYGGQITIYVWEKVRRLCELNNSRNYVKCNSTLCVMNNAMQDIQEYFENGKDHLLNYVLIRNIDVVVTGMLDINNLLLGIGINKQGKAIENVLQIMQL